MVSVSTNIRLDADVKKAAQKLFADLGMDMTTAVNIFLRQAVREQRIPFEIRSERFNAETLAVLKDVEQRKNLRGPFNTVDEFMDDLDAQD